MTTGNVDASTNLLVVDGSQINGKVVLVTYRDDQDVTAEEVVADAAFFSPTGKGDFIYRSRSNNWWFGDVKRRGSISGVPSVPAGVVYAALSPDGTTVVWCMEDAQSTSLVLGSVETAEQRTLFSRTGVVRVPSWSPQSDRIAYYYGPPDVLATDRFTLETISVRDPRNEIQRLAPASQPTGITADRTQPPRWSPDGARILFVGNYESDNLVRSSAYVTGSDGTGLTRVDGNAWSADGTQLLYVTRTSLPFGPLALATLDLSTGTSRNIDLPFDLPASLGNGRWKSDGKKFAFITNDNEVHLIDIDKKREVKLIDFVEGANLFWLE